MSEMSAYEHRDFGTIFIILSTALFSIASLQGFVSGGILVTTSLGVLGLVCAISGFLHYSPFKNSLYVQTSDPFIFSSCLALIFFILINKLVAINDVLSVFVFLLVLLVSVTIFYSFSGIRWFYSRFRKVSFLFKANFPKPKIGILNGLTSPTDIPAPCPREWTDLTPSDWYIFLKNKNKYSLHYISTSEIDDSFDVIINPFGEVYPEEDIFYRKSFRKIVEYIQKGGSFVTTCFPFWYYFDTKRRKKEPSAMHEIEQTIIGNKQVFKSSKILFEDSLFSRFFSVKIDGCPYSSGKVFQKPSDRNRLYFSKLPKKLPLFRGISLDSPNFVPILRAKISQTSSGDESVSPKIEVSILSLISFRKGIIIHGGFVLQNQRNLNLFEQVIWHNIQNK
jgi:hypothetical protein